MALVFISLLDVGLVFLVLICRGLIADKPDESLFFVDTGEKKSVPEAGKLRTHTPHPPLLLTNTSMLQSALSPPLHESGRGEDF